MLNGSGRRRSGTGRSARGVLGRASSGGVLGADTPGSYQHHAARSNWAAARVFVKVALAHGAADSASGSAGHFAATQSAQSFAFTSSAEKYNPHTNKLASRSTHATKPAEPCGRRQHGDFGRTQRKRRLGRPVQRSFDPGARPGQVVIQQHSIPTDTLGGNGPTDRDLCRQAYMIAGL
jgi:hypothetical protein